MENREGRQKEFDEFVAKLKEYSKSDKPSKLESILQPAGYPGTELFGSVWVVAKEDEERKRAEAAQKQARLALEMQKRREEIKQESLRAQ